MREVDQRRVLFHRLQSFAPGLLGPSDNFGRYPLHEPALGILTFSSNGGFKLGSDERTKAKLESLHDVPRS